MPEKPKAPTKLKESGGDGNASTGPAKTTESGGDNQKKKIETVVYDEPKLGRNDPCWCGSGKKYKQCHWRKDQERRASA